MARSPGQRPPWLSPEDARMLRALPDSARRDMGNLLHQQARSEESFRARFQLRGELAELEPSRERTPQGRRRPIQVMNDVPPDMADVYLQAWRALLASGRSQAAVPDGGGVSAAADRVLSWYVDDPQVPALVRALGDQERDDARSFSVERAAREVGIPPTSARRYLHYLIEEVVGEWLVPLSNTLGLAATLGSQEAA